MIGAYSVSKTALLGLVKALASECGSMNVRVNAIAPGIIKTNFSTLVSIFVDCFSCSVLSLISFRNLYMF